jgi:hypothetical protein
MDVSLPSAAAPEIELIRQDTSNHWRLPRQPDPQIEPTIPWQRLRRINGSALIKGGATVINWSRGHCLST